MLQYHSQPRDNSRSKTATHLMCILWLLLLCSACKTSQCGECGNTDVLNDKEKEIIGTPAMDADNSEERIAILKGSDSPLTIDIVIWNIAAIDDPVIVRDDKLNQMLTNLNAAYAPLNIQFRLLDSRIYTDYFTFEDLAEDNYEKYYYNIIQHNTANTIDIYLVDHNKDLCFVTENARGCTKGKGFTSTGGWTSSIVIAKDDVTDMKVPIHEFGHFFNLEHTFKDYNASVDAANCEILGDSVCDTPADPGDGFGAMVNYTDCEMHGVYDINGQEYKPMINNYMAYFGACFMKPYEFTDGQISRMKTFIYSEKRYSYLKMQDEL